MTDYVVPASAKATPAELLKWANANGVQEVDIRFTDIRGMVQHFSMPIGAVDVGLFEDGFGFDGSSVRGFQSIDQSDLILFADLETAVIDPFYAKKTIAFFCDVYDPINREPYGRDPRGVAKRAEAFLAASGIADVAYFGPELEFFIFSNIRYESNQYKSYYEVDSHEGFWNTSNPY
jgi:glutamine synthetase